MIFFINSQICYIRIANFCCKNDMEAFGYDSAIKKFIKYEITFLITLSIIAVSGFFLSSKNDYKFADPMVLAVITTLWVCVAFILVNFAYMHYKMVLLKKALKSQSDIEVKEHLIIITKYFIPLNIAISLICVYLGVTISEF